MTKNKGFITIPSATTHKLFNMGEVGRDAFTLYGFLQYTSIWQNEKFGINNRPKATRGYCKKGLHWGTDRTRLATKTLVDIGLVTKRITRDEKGHVTGHYVELPYVNHMTSTEVTWTENPHDLETHRMGSGSPNTDSKNNLNTDDKDILKNPKTTTLLNGMTGLSMPAQTISNLSPIISDYFQPQEIEEIKNQMRVSNEDLRLATENCNKYCIDNKKKLTKTYLELWLTKPMNYIKAKKSSTIFKET